MSEPEELRGATCPACGGLLDFDFRSTFKELAHMTIGDEFLTLEPFPVLLKCTQCTWQRDTVGRDFTINMKAGVILHGRIDKPED